MLRGFKEGGNREVRLKGLELRDVGCPIHFEDVIGPKIIIKGKCIACYFRSMFGLKVPINTVVMNEGRSGYALATGYVNRTFVLENVAFYVTSPEACAKIVWKLAQTALKIIEYQKKLARIKRRSQATSIATGSIYLPTSGSSKLTEAQGKLQQPFIEFYE
nr:acetyl-coenzyme A carboxylase carboxyl transferase subunit alpha, chloroplastic [Tanacetum cinerariifolium]